MGNNLTSRLQTDLTGGCLHINTLPVLYQSYEGPISPKPSCPADVPVLRQRLCNSLSP